MYKLCLNSDKNYSRVIDIFCGKPVKICKNERVLSWLLVLLELSVDRKYQMMTEG